MILHWIEEKLRQRAFQGRHEVIKLEWKRAELERLLEAKKREVELREKC